MNRRCRVMTTAACMVLTPWIVAGQAFAPGTPPDLERRVFVDVNRVTPSKVLDELCDTIACTLQVDPKLQQPDISLRLSNVRARTALDAVCDMVGCRWTLKGRVLVVTATNLPPAPPKVQEWMERIKAPLLGEKWNLVRVPLRDVLASLSQELAADVTFEGTDLGAPITLDLRGVSGLEALQRVQSATGSNVVGGQMGSNPNTGRQEIRFRNRKELGSPPGPGITPDERVYQKDEPGLTLPRVVYEVRPAYTAGAQRAGIQGTVVLSVVVTTEGTIGDVKVTKSLQSELDAEAIKAAKRWRFTPGTKDGKPVPVAVTLELTFTLR
jgi:TonB family protein